MKILQEYYSAVGRVAQTFGGTTGHIAGDGIMVFFNDPVEIPQPNETAVKMALEVRDLLGQLCGRWKKQEKTLSFGAGIAAGHATIGGIGGEGCWDYSVIGTVTNLASRLCSEAKNGQILMAQRFLAHVNDFVEAEPTGEILLKGLNKPVQTYNLLKWKEKAA